MFSVSTHQLESGLKVVAVPMPAVKSVTALLLVNTGSRYEEKTEHGAAHLLEHLVFRGTKSYPDTLKLSIAFDSIGGSSNAFTSKEYTGFYVNAASRHLEYCLNLLKELVFFPLIRPKDVEQEKAVVIEEIKMYHDSPDDLVNEEFERSVYQGSSLEHPISGSISSVQNQSAGSLRRFLNKWYGLDNLTLVIAGDAKKLNSASCLRQIKQVFSHEQATSDLQKELQKRANHHQERRQEFLTDNPISTKKKVSIKKETEQTHLVLGWPGLRRDDPDRYVLTVLANVMGGNRSSRLFHVVREQANLAYYIYADVDQYHDGGMMSVSAGLNRERTSEGIELIQQQFQDVVEGKAPITAKELERAKDYLNGRIVLGLESSRAVAQHYGLSWLLLGRLEDPQKVIDGIRQVELNEVEELAKKLIQPKEMRLAKVG